MPPVKTHNDFSKFLLNEVKNKGLSDDYLRDQVQLDPRTWRKRKKSPETFTTAQLLTISKTLEIPFSRIAELSIKEFSK